jgi:putative ATP-binding cassette transporter
MGAREERVFTDASPERAALGAHVGTIVDALAVARERNVLVMLGLALVIVIAATAWGQIRLNAWNQPFYDALARKDLQEVLVQLKTFATIAFALLVLNVGQNWLSLIMKLRLRATLTRDLIDSWLAPRRAFFMSGSGEIGVNPDQRIHSDVLRLAETSTDLGVGLLQSTLLLASFVGVLWNLSGAQFFTVDAESFSVPGYMVWCALLYAALASLASWRIGRPLAALGVERYARESDARVALVETNDNNEAIALARAEDREKAQIMTAFIRLFASMERLVGASTRLMWVTAGYGWFAIVAPLIVAAPAYFSGTLTFGGLLMAAGAFTQVQQSLRWFIDNAGLIADWRASVARVGAFRLALTNIARNRDETMRSGPGMTQINREETKDHRFLLRDIVLDMRGGSSRLNASDIEIRAGDRVSITGAHGCGKTMLFRALAGLWSGGHGTITAPPDDSLMFIPKRAFAPRLSLAALLAYPRDASDFDETDMKTALARFDLGYLDHALDRIADWEADLADADRQALAFTRLLLFRPDFVVIDEAIDNLSEGRKTTLRALLDNELKNTGLIYISGPRPEDRLFTRTYSLEAVTGISTPRGDRGADAV